MNISARSIPTEKTPNYKVAYYAFDCFNMQDKNGRKYGYGYDMMQDISKYMQSTFSYVGFNKSAQECVQMLRDKKLDIYTAAKKTPERESEFAFSKHPAITATTRMNVKRGNESVIPGDYSTYNGLRIGLLKRHTYNEKFIEFTKEKGFDCTIVYYETPTELSNALIDGQVDALVNSYIRTPEDEKTIENFGETPYYFMTRKEDQSLIDKIDRAIDKMNIETPNWRTDLYNQYYGSQNLNTKLTTSEKIFLYGLKKENVTIKAVMNPDNNPYSWYEGKRAKGIIADLFKETATKLGLKYKIIPVSNKEEYEQMIHSGKVDVWMDVDSYIENNGKVKYITTNPFLNTSVSVLKRRGNFGKIKTIGVLQDNANVRDIIFKVWPKAQIQVLNDTQDCVRHLVNEDVDCVLLMSYTAQMLAREDAQNRLSVDVVPGVSLDFEMGIRSDVNRNFYGLWEKTLSEVAEKKSSELMQDYLETTNTPSLMAYLFDHPIYIVFMAGVLFFMILIFVMYLESVKTKNEQLKISKQLSQALAEAHKANDAKVNFFSKMSHDIRTPMNAVLGMTQIAKKYKQDPDKLENALDNITHEGNYLLTMINSILDVNQLEHGHVELVEKPFKPYECMQECVEILKPLAHKKQQTLFVTSNFTEDIAVGDANRFNQIMVNIISNAIKYTPVKGTIRISMFALEKNRYRFVCSDNGIGMDKDYIQHICEDYSRAEDSRISSNEGTGLGMAVVKGFTELMHGDLKIESELGKGSCFMVEIPFKAPTQKECELLEAKTTQKWNSAHFKGKRVLLVEDNALNAQIATELLQSIGLEIDWAENGKIALEKYKQNQNYFTIFMDMQMPVMDGLKTTEEIRKIDADIPIFAMTANTLEKDKINCKQAGMNGYISKPINLKDICETLNEQFNYA